MNLESVEHRAAKVSLVTGLSTLMAVGFQLISVPICLQYWGKQTYGSWLTLYAAFVLVRSLDIGYISYIGNKLNYFFHQDQKILHEHLASSLTGIAVIGLIQLTIGIAAIFSNHLVTWLGMPSIYLTDYQYSFALLVLLGTWVLSGSYLGIVHRLMIPTGLMYQASWWSMGFQASQFIAIILAALLALDMLQTSLLFAFAQLSIYLASALYIRRKLPAYYPWWRGGRPRTAIKDLRHSILLTASNLIQQGSTNGTVLLISALSGPAAVPVFTTVRTLTNLWSNVTNVLTAPLLPDVVRYRATGAGQKLVKISETYWVLVGSLVNIGVFITYPLIEPMYEYWTGNAVALDKRLLCLLLASIVLTNAGGLVTLYLNGINRLGAVLTASVIRGFLVLVVGGFLFFHFELAGFGIAILTGEIFVLLMLGYYFITRELPQQSVRRTLLAIGPISLSSMSVILFLIGEGLGFSFAPCLYLGVFMGLATAALWGWRSLDADVRARLVGIFGDRMITKSVS